MPGISHTSPDAEVLFLGTGIMGTHMARHIAAAGFKVLAWNRSPDKAEALRSARVTPVKDLASLPVACRVAVVMLSTGQVVDGVLFDGTAGPPVAELLAENSIVIVMSSTPVECARLQSKRLGQMRIRYLDAPVSGGEKGAREGTLSIMVGGEQEAINEVLPILQSMGSVTRIGPVGTGQLAKMANQTIVGITIGAVAEALVLAEAGGAEPAAVREALLGGFADSTILRQHGDRMVRRNFQPGAHATTQLKDLKTALAAGEAGGGSYPILSLCTRLFEELCQSSRAVLDHSVFYLDARDRANLDVTESQAGRT